MHLHFCLILYGCEKNSTSRGNPQMNYLRAFQRFDTDATGKMKLDDLDKIMQELGKSRDERWL